MFFFIGLAVVFGAVLGGYVLAGGKMAPIIKAAPFEFIIIAGAAVGASLVGNSFDIFKAAMGGIGKGISGLSAHFFTQDARLVGAIRVAGKADEALAVAKANEGVLEASYNLAAIYAQLGDKKKAMELLRRHFESYERFDAVRAMEMKEARDDYMFLAMHQDPEFIALTKLARNAWMIGNEFCDPASLLASPEAPLRRM